jgi:outer membrane biosynthesis protein TonB
MPAPLAATDPARADAAAPPSVDASTAPGAANEMDASSAGPPLPRAPVGGAQALPAGYYSPWQTRALRLVGNQAKRCARQGLAADPGMHGNLVVLVLFGATGRVESVQVQLLSGISNEVAQCITHAIKQLAFDPPDTPQAIQIPFVM